MYQCRHCGTAFYRQPHKSANKYCTRECAFDAKRLRAAARLHPYEPLAAWLLNWGANSAPPVNGDRVRGTSHKARCMRFGVPYEPIRRSRVFREAGWLCGICGRGLLMKYTIQDGKVDPRSPTIDCIIPLAAGPGSPGYVYGNVQACCHACNIQKSDSIEPGALQTIH